MTSGFFNTNAYQLASKAVEPDEQVRVASIMSFVFTIDLMLFFVCNDPTRIIFQPRITFIR